MSYELSEGIIRSAERMTYTDVNAVLEGDADMRQRYAALVPGFELMRDLALILNRKRERRGSIDFDLPEPVIEFDEYGLMKSITRSERNIAHRLIEEFMLSANECVASYLENKRIASLYRIHEKPDAKRVYDFEVIAATFGYSLGVGPLPIQRVQLKTDRRADYGTGKRSPGDRNSERSSHHAAHVSEADRKNCRQAGRADSFLPDAALAEAGAILRGKSGPLRPGGDLLYPFHFADPALSGSDRAPDSERSSARFGERRDGDIGRRAVAARRLPGSRPSIAPPDAGENDLRPGRSAATTTLIAKQSSPNGGPIPIEELHDIAEESSQSERRADEAERELMEWKKVKFMQDRVGEDFDGLIISVTKFGFFVELTDLFVEGLVPLDTLTDDRYTYHENTREIIGQRNRKIYSLGQKVRVLVDRIDPVEKKIQFALLEEKPRSPSARIARALV